jgi:hypothetical protein
VDDVNVKALARDLRSEEEWRAHALEMIDAMLSDLAARR